MRAGDVIPINLGQFVTANVDSVPVMECGSGIFNGQYALRVNKMIASEDAIKAVEY